MGRAADETDEGDTAWALIVGDAACPNAPAASKRVNRTLSPAVLIFMSLAQWRYSNALSNIPNLLPQFLRAGYRVNRDKTHSV
jgi:hypothetical protein